MGKNRYQGGVQGGAEWGEGAAGTDAHTVAIGQDAKVHARSTSITNKWGMLSIRVEV